MRILCECTLSSLYYNDYTVFSFTLQFFIQHGGKKIMKTLTSPTLWELAVPYLASFVGSLVVAIGMNAFFIPFH